MSNQSSYPKAINDELISMRDDLLGMMKTFLSLKIWTKDIDGMRDFVKYINRYTASEVQFLIDEKGYKADIEAIIQKIEDDIQSSPTTAKEASE